MALLKEDGSLDMERIEKLNIFEFMEEAGGWTREQMQYLAYPSGVTPYFLPRR